MLTETIKGDKTAVDEDDDVLKRYQLTHFDCYIGERAANEDPGRF